VYVPPAIPGLPLPLPDTFFIAIVVSLNYSDFVLLCECFF
jgi:hypothetical protein